MVTLLSCIANKRVLDFLTALPDMEMFHITDAADALKIPRLIDLCLVFFLIKAEGKDTKALRKEFDLRDDYTEQEEADIRKKHEVTA
uniref:Skp1 domain-containing protein n=1 Tax=Panagrellus redivivus TaxID=6233 RepID=A0A7E4W7G6_PANRE